jgi:mono/diheme cytochrome c family protein/glucose/arabinose dehydrogenase
MRPSDRSTHPRALTAALIAVSTAGLSLFAQSPPSPATARVAQAPVPRVEPPLEPAALDPRADFSPKPPVQALSAQEEQKRFILPPGYHLELVLSEPDVVNPVAIAFDGNGRMFVSEMRSYMVDADGTYALDPISRISVHESTKGDGKYDRHVVFADRLVLPRFVLPMDGHSVLTMETDADDIVQYTDTDGDGVADKKAVFFSGAGRRGNLEHQQSGFIWALDNWIYSTYNAFRIRWTPKGILKEPTPPNYGQWGLTQDDNGKPWFVDAGGEKGPINFQVPIVYGGLNVADQFEPGFEVTWPAPGISDMQGGMDRIRMPIGALNHFTAACGPDIFRGDRLPADLRGDLLFAEPVGRMIRRSKIVVTEGLTQLRNAYPNSEFILSTDPLFRPVNLTTAPDGTLYIADMYHGIIQESEWTPRGSYLRRKIDQLQLDKVKGYGRVWRLVHDGFQPDRQRPRMLDETAAQLVAHLEHPNGWWRDTAQRLIVLRQDLSIVPALREMARSSRSILGRFHATWSLEGLGALDAALVRELMRDLNPLVRAQAIRASESLYKAGDTSFEANLRELANDEDTRVVMQALLTLNLLKTQNAGAVTAAAQAANRARGVQVIAARLLNPAEGRGSFVGAGHDLTPPQLAIVQHGEAIYQEVCAACHGADGKGTAVDGAPAGTMKAPPLAGSPRVQGHRGYVIAAVMHGLRGPVDGNTYTDVMVPMGSNNDDWISAIASYVRNSFGNEGTVISPADVARVRSASAGRRAPWTVAELQATLPVPLHPDSSWKATASHNPAAAPRAMNEGLWTTDEPQHEGMWFQIELPAPAPVTELEFDSPAADGDAPAPPPAGFPRRYLVQVSMDGTTWSQPVAEGEGDGISTIVTFKPVVTRFVRITQTATVANAPPWSIRALRIYAAPQSQNNAR